MDGSPTVRRRRLGLILRGLREKSSMTGEEVAVAIERSGSWVSRVETGRVGLRGRDLNDLLDIYRIDDRDVREELLSLAREGKQRGWWSKYADTLSGPYATYIGFEAEAGELLVFETLVVHGLLQTEAYARALFGAAIPANSPDMIERKVKVRMERQALLDGPTPLRLWAILDESVLRRQVGPVDVRVEQLRHLTEMARRDNVTIQVLPFSGGHHPSAIESFTVIKFSLIDDPDIVYLEGGPGAGGIFVEIEDAKWYNVVFDHLRAAALSPAESCEMLDRMREETA